MRAAKAAAVLPHLGEPAIAAIFWHYAVAQFAAAFALVYLFPRVIVP